MLVNTVLTNVKTCFVVLLGILIIHCPCLKHVKQFLFIFIYFCWTPPLIKTPCLSIHLCQPPPKQFGPPQLIWHCEEYVFQNWGVACNYRVQEEVVAIYDCLLVVSVHLLVVCSRLLWFVVVY